MHYYTGLSYSIFSISFITGLFSYRYLSIIESFIYAVIVRPISDAANNDVRARSSHTITIPYKTYCKACNPVHSANNGHPFYFSDDVTDYVCHYSQQKKITIKK